MHKSDYYILNTDYHNNQFESILNDSQKIQYLITKTTKKLCDTDGMKSMNTNMKWQTNANIQWRILASLILLKSQTASNTSLEFNVWSSHYGQTDRAALILLLKSNSTEISKPIWQYGSQSRKTFTINYIFLNYKFQEFKQISCGIILIIILQWHSRKGK